MSLKTFRYSTAPLLLISSFSFLVLLTYSFFRNEPFLLLTYFVVYYIGLILLRSVDSQSISFFKWSFYINVISSVFLSIYFEQLNGDPFIGGGDDKAFYEISKVLTNGGNYHLSSINYRAYVFIFSLWYKVLGGLGDESQHFLHLNLINSFYGAFSPALIYLIGLKLFDRKTAHFSSLLTLLYSPFIFYSATIIRDILVASLTFAIIYLAICSDDKRVNRYAIIFFLLFLLFNIRGASGFFALFFLISFFVLKAQMLSKILVKLLVVLVLLSATGIHIVATLKSPPYNQPPITEVLSFLSYKSHYYKDLMIHQSDANSLGVRLRDSNNPFFIFASLVYMYLSPIPPMFVKESSISNVLLGIGNLIWHYCSILFLLLMFYRERFSTKDVFRWALMSTLLFTVIILTFTSGDPRHFYFIHPLVFLYCIDALIRNKKLFSQYSYLFLIVSMTGTIIYLLLKQSL